MSEELPSLLRALGKVGFECIPGQLADALWIAGRLDPRLESASPSEPRISHGQEILESSEPEREAEPEPEENLLDVHLPGERTATAAELRGRALRVPTFTALPGALDIARALRPLTRRLDSRFAKALDAEATARRIAEEAIWEPVLLPAPERWLDLSLVVDNGRSMNIWHSTVLELRRWLGWLGAFRRSRDWTLHTEDLLARVTPGLWRPSHLGAHRGAPDLPAADDRQLVLVITDCVSSAWQTQDAFELLAAWASRARVVIIQMLPESLWARSALSDAPSADITAGFEATNNRRFQAAYRAEWLDWGPLEGLPIPVLPLDPQAMKRLAALLTRSGNNSTPGIMATGHSSRLTPSASPREPQVSPETLLDRFWASASPIARRLGILLAAAPILTLPVLRLIRRSLLPEARQSHEAEVLLSGLFAEVSPSTGTSARREPDTAQYQLVEGLRPLLLDSLRTTDAVRILDIVSSYIERHLGQLRGFQAILADPHAAEGCFVPDRSPIGRIASEVLRRIGGEYARLVSPLPRVSAKTSPQQRASMRNKAGPPVRKDDFLERRPEVQELWLMATRGHVLLQAPRRTGKTSLLHHMADVPAEGWTCLFLNVESLDSEAHFVARLLATISQAHPDGAWLEVLSAKAKKILAEMGLKLGPVEFDLAEVLKDDWRDTGAALLRMMRKLKGNTLILIDEFPQFVQNLLARSGDAAGKRRAELFLHWFRDVRNALTGGGFQVHFLLTGSIELADIVQAAGLTQTFNDLHSFRLGPLTAEQARELLRRLSEGESLPLPAAVIERILERIDWAAPYHLQLLFQEILSNVKFRGRHLDVAVVDEAYAALLASDKRSYFSHWAERLEHAFGPQERDLGKALLWAAARNPKGSISQGTVIQIQRKTAPDVNAKAVLSRLDHDGYLTLHEGRWCFTSALLRDWWLKWQAKAS